jgi:TIR domain
MAEEQKVFFSYSRVDGEKFALKLATDLRKAGCNIWIDQLDIRPGKPWDLEIEKALETATCILFIATEKSTGSKNTLDEVYYALDKNIEVIPVIFGNCQTPFRLKDCSILTLLQITIPL